MHGLKKKRELSKRIFIVHGHDEEMKQDVTRTIKKLGLSPIILHELPNKGRTIIEKFTKHADDVSFALVLLSPDDIGYRYQSKSKTPKPRARQNVIFEFGYFIGKLGRERVVALHKVSKNFEMPSDYSGVIFVPYESKGSWKFQIVQELKASGYEVDANKLL